MPKKPKPTTLAQRIRTAREAAGLTQTAAARAAGIAQNALSQIESGKYEPGFRAGVALSLALGVDPVTLAGIERGGVLPPEA